MTSNPTSVAACRSAEVSSVDSLSMTVSLRSIPSDGPAASTERAATSANSDVLWLTTAASITGRSTLKILRDGQQPINLNRGQRLLPLAATGPLSECGEELA